MAERIQKNEILRIKLEIDTDPPSGFKTEAKTLLQPIPFSVNTYAKPDLFAGKIHAILHRQWKNRVKGRDYYDFVWFIGQDVPVSLFHLEQRLRQSGGWTKKQVLKYSDLILLLKKKLAEVDFELAKQDVLPFVKDPAAVQLWSQEFFESLVLRLKVEC
jgi:hypothetical protein